MLQQCVSSFHVARGCNSVAASGTAMLWLAGSMRRRTFQGKDVGGYSDSALVKRSVETTQSRLGIFIKGIFLEVFLNVHV